MIINTNVEALRTSNILNSSNRSLGESLARLSSGSKIVNPSDDAAGIAVSSRLKAQVSRIDSAITNNGNAISFTQTQDGFLKIAASTARRMGELSILAQDITKTDTDRALYQKEYSQLDQQLTAISGRKFNGNTLWPAATQAIVADEDPANTITLPIAAFDTAQTTVSAGDISTVAGAGTALTKINTFINSVAGLRAEVGAVQARLNFNHSQLEIMKENLSSSISKITDVNMAQESTNYAKYQILVNSGTAMLTQANTLPQAALRLIQ